MRVEGSAVVRKSYVRGAFKTNICIHRRKSLPLGPTGDAIQGKMLPEYRSARGAGPFSHAFIEARRALTRTYGGSHALDMAADNREATCRTYKLKQSVCDANRG
jgi:hypothetical protein